MNAYSFNQKVNNIAIIQEEEKWINTEKVFFLFSVLDFNINKNIQRKNKSKCYVQIRVS